MEAAIDSRYPELKRENGQGIGHDYLEKMLQLQVTVPALSAAETETYVNLLVSQLHVDADQFKGACRSLRERASDPFAPSYNTAVAADLLGDAFTAALSDDMTWATEIAPALSGLGGNPRRIKRFLNDLTWRRRAAARRGVDLRQDVLAKLMVLEDQSSEDFQTLFDWQVRAAGPSPELVFAETLARGDSQQEEVPQAAGRRAKKADAEPETPPAADPVAELATGWAERPMVARWLQLQPGLRETDLRPYFSYFRDRLVIGAVASALKPELQVLLGKITSDVALVSRKACGDFEQLSQPDQDEVVRALLDSVQRRPDGPAMFPMCEIAARVARVAPTICEGLSRLPHQVLTPQVVVGVARRLDKVPERADLFAGWASSPVDAVAKAATAAMRPRAGS